MVYGGNSDFAVGFGRLIEQAILRKGWQHKQVADAVWGDPNRTSHVAGYINGNRGRPGAKIPKAFCDALDIPPEEIDALRAREREAARQQAAELNIPLPFLDRIAGQFWSEETFTDWPSFEEELRLKAGTEPIRRLRMETPRRPSARTRPRPQQHHTNRQLGLLSRESGDLPPIRSRSPLSLGVEHNAR